MAQQFEQLNTNGHLVQDFVKRYGYPVWDKSSLLKKQFTATARGNADNNDTVIIIPVVVPNAQEVKTYIEATLSDTVALAVHITAEYKYLPFSKDSSKIIGAEKMAIRFMLLNQDVFNHRSFTIVDKRLFNCSANYTDTGKLKRTITLPKKNTGSKLSNNIYDAGLLADEICIENTTLTIGHHCGTPSYAKCIPNCDNCGTYCYDYWNAETYTTCMSWPDDTGMPPSTGGGSGGGGGGGSTNPEPCTGAGAINGLGMPCDPTNPPTQPPGGIGWVPIDDETIDFYSNEVMSDEYISEDLQNSNLVDIDPTPQKPRPLFVDLKNSALLPSDPSVVAMLIGGGVETQLNKPGQSNTCGARLSYALNYSNNPIPFKPFTIKGGDNKNYILGAATMLAYLKQTYGTDPTNTIHLESQRDAPLTHSQIFSAMLGKQGIYVIIPNDPSNATGFGATGHVDILDSNGIFSSGNYHYYCKGGVKEVYLFILN